MRFDRRGCMLALGALVLAGAAGYALAILVAWALISVLRGLLPQDPLIIVVLVVALPLWFVFTAGPFLVYFRLRSRWEAARRRCFEGRAALTDEEFVRLFPGVPAQTVAEVRGERGGFPGVAEVAQRLLPADPVRATCFLAGANSDDLDWAEFLARLEGRCGGRLPEEWWAGDVTVADLVARCARAVEVEQAPD